MKLTLTKDLTPLRQSANDRIDALAADARKLFITLAPGQDQVYALKKAEAELYLRDPSTVSVDALPHLYAEHKATGTLLSVIARTVVDKAREWSEISAQIETLRLTAKSKVKVALTPADIEAAVASLDMSSIRAQA